MFIRLFVSVEFVNPGELQDPLDYILFDRLFYHEINNNRLKTNLNAQIV